MSEILRWRIVRVGLWLMFVSYLGLSLVAVFASDVDRLQTTEPAWFSGFIAAWSGLVLMSMIGLGLTYVVPPEGKTRLATTITLLATAFQFAPVALMMSVEDEEMMFLAALLSPMFSLLALIGQYCLTKWLAEYIRCSSAEDMTVMLKYLLITAALSICLVCPLGIFAILITGVAMLLYQGVYGWCLFELSRCVSARARGRSVGW